MCAVSMVTDYYRQPGNLPFQWPQAAPAALPWTPDAFSDLKEILKRVKDLDTKLGLPDCEDPKKAEWMKSIEDRLAKLETAT